MAEWRESELSTDVHDSDESRDTALSDWTEREDLDTRQKMSKIIRAIIMNSTVTGIQSLDQLRTILKCGWDVNEVLSVYNDSDSKQVHRTALHEAARLGWTEGVKMLLDAGAKFTKSDVLKNPLALALQNEDCPTDLIKLLLKHGADPNEHDDRFDNIPLLNAIGNDQDDVFDTTIVKLLLDHGANPNVAYGAGKGHKEFKWEHRTPLHEAASRGWTEGVKILLNAGAKFTTPDALQNPLVLVLKNQDCLPDLIKLLLEHGADPNDHDHQLENIPLLNGIVNQRNGKNDLIIVQLLLEHGANPNVNHKINVGRDGKSEWVLQNPLALALKDRNCPADLIDLLLTHGADPNDHDDQPENIPLLNAMVYQRNGTQRDGTNDLIIVQLLLEHGANPNLKRKVNIERYGSTRWVSQNSLALALKDHNCPPELIELLLKHGADPNNHDDQLVNIPLLITITKHGYCQNDTIIVKLLLEYGANPNVGTQMVRNALHEAVRLGRTEVAKMLHDAGADWSTSDMSSDFQPLQNPLAVALENHNCPPELIELLLKHGADPNHHNTHTDIPLLNAITNTRNDLHLAKIVQDLLEHGANPHAVFRVEKGKNKWVHRTGLHQAASRGWTEGVRMLLGAGAKFVTSDILVSPLALALQNEDCPTDLIELLLKHGVDVNYSVDEYMPMLHGLCSSQFGSRHYHKFRQQELDLFFLHGGNINMEGGGGLNYKTALECHLRGAGNSNNVRWLIRHGADTALEFTMLREHFMRFSWGVCHPDTPLILLQAGVRVSPVAQTLLNTMQVAISTYLQEPRDHYELERTLRGIWNQMEEANEEELQTKQCNLKKSTYPEYWAQQMVDLQEFSEESLYVYPEDDCSTSSWNNNQGFQNKLDQIHIVLEVLSQPQSLQLHCRHCIRENLVSLQPSVVKSLPGPSRLKRYILCHEI